MLTILVGQEHSWFLARRKRRVGLALWEGLAKRDVRACDVQASPDWDSIPWLKAATQSCFLSDTREGINLRDLAGELSCISLSSARGESE